MNAGNDFDSGWELNVVPACPRCGSQECYALDEERVECFRCHEVFLHPVLVRTGTLPKREDEDEHEDEDELTRAAA